jgi:4-coumarate--CoA ligase
MILYIWKAYGMTEVAGRVFATVGMKESRIVGATGKVMSNSQAKIVDPDTGIGLPPMMPGELWIRGPSNMKGKCLDVGNLYCI